VSSSAAHQPGGHGENGHGHKRRNEVNEDDTEKNVTIAFSVLAPRNWNASDHPDPSVGSVSLFVNPRSFPVEDGLLPNSPYAITRSYARSYMGTIFSSQNSCRTRATAALVTLA
jgi:hypothetical protein